LISKHKLSEIAGRAGITEIGATTADPLTCMLERLELRVNESRLTPFEEHNPALRISPAALLEGCRSIIVVAIPFSGPEIPVPQANDSPRGQVARCARSVDYHLLVDLKAGELVHALRKEYGTTLNYRVLVDRNPLLERELARRSGLGIIGTNCTLINHRYGSYTALGTILLDREVEETGAKAESETCQNCGKCLEACPTGALTEPFIMNPQRCLSYLSQASGVYPQEYRIAAGNRLYGCDRCQEVCPLNEGVKPSPLPETTFKLFPAEPLLIPLLSMTQREYDLTIGLTSAGWRGKTTLQRNTVIALGNSKNEAAVKPLARLLENDPRPIIRQHAAWALGRIGSPKARLALDRSLKYDQSPEVNKEAKQALT
jgi:epoxyqueuosine reductase